MWFRFHIRIIFWYKRIMRQQKFIVLSSVKFHIAAILMNAILIYGIMSLYSLILTSMDEAYFVKKGHYFNLCFLYLMFVFNWVSTVIIYTIKNQSTHFYYFLGFNFFSLLSYILFIDTNSPPFEISGLFISLEYAIPETIIPTIIISKCVSMSQNIIGRKLLPTRYC